MKDPVRHISTGSPFEARIGYSRAVVADGLVHVAGTTGYDYATMTIVDDVGAQTRQCLANIDAALRKAGCSMRDVVRVRYLLPRAEDFPLAWPALREVFDICALEKINTPLLHLATPR